MNRTFFLGGNWKCNGTTEFTRNLITGLNNASWPQDINVVIAPPMVQLGYASSFNLPSQIKLSAQNASKFPSGAYTGETSLEMLEDLGINWTILGHSERRHIFKECNETIGAKVKRALEKKFNVIACIGETKEERQSGNTMKVLIAQLEAIANNVENDQWNRVVIAYEPVWAIGTGLTASPEQAEEVHANLRSWISKNVSPKIAASTTIIYGGSVKPKNASTLIQKPNIDGFLVGGACLKAASFAAIGQCQSIKAKL